MWDEVQGIAEDGNRPEEWVRRKVVHLGILHVALRESGPLELPIEMVAAVL